MPQLREITQHQLDADSLTILRHVEDGERFVVTRDGTPVAELAPVRRETPDVVTLFDGAAPGLGPVLRRPRRRDGRALPLVNGGGGRAGL